MEQLGLFTLRRKTVCFYVFPTERVGTLKALHLHMHIYKHYHLLHRTEECKVYSAASAAPTPAPAPTPESFYSTVLLYK